jgi:NAD(P)-dependent dehydrogenase (short-subunit alcohol dehydrogenase family)
VAGTGSSAWRFVECNVPDPVSVEQALARVQDVCPFDVVINNAGLIYNSPLLTFQAGKLSMHDFDAWNRVLSATLSSVFFVSAHCARQMVAAGKPGVIINISSMVGLVGGRSSAAYVSIKHALVGFTRSDCARSRIEGSASPGFSAPDAT